MSEKKDCIIRIIEDNPSSREYGDKIFARTPNEMDAFLRALGTVLSRHQTKAILDQLDDFG